MDVISAVDRHLRSLDRSFDPMLDSRIRVSGFQRAALLLDVPQESAQLAADLLREARIELHSEECDPRADDLTIAVARQKVYVAQRRLLAARMSLGFEHDHACECC
jgi:hypothetical protein